MIQKLKSYEVHRTERQYNEIGEEIPGAELVFPLEAVIAVSTGNTTYNNLIQSVQSTHTAIFYVGDLRQGDVIVDGDGRYKVDYVYRSLRRGVAYLRLDGDSNG